VVHRTTTNAFCSLDCFLGFCHCKFVLFAVNHELCPHCRSFVSLYHCIIVFGLQETRARGHVDNEKSGLRCCEVKKPECGPDTNIIIITTGMSQDLKSLLENDEIYKTVSFVVADARQADCPIVFASPSFFEVTLYSPQETLGRNCRFLQGKDTSRHAIGEIRDAIREERETNVCLLNYRKDGTTFWNAFHLHPVQDGSGQVKFFIGIQCDVTPLFMVPDPSINLDALALSEANRKSEDTARRLAEDIGSRARELLSTRSKTCVSDSISTPLAAGLGHIDHAFVLTDATELKMQYCSRGFLKMMGSSADEVLGRGYLEHLGSCRDDIDREELERIRRALRADPPMPVSAVLKCSRKNGQSFYNALYIAPVNGSDGRVAYFCGVQTELKDIDQSHGASNPTTVGAGTCTSTVVRLRQRGVIGAVRVATRGLGSRDLSRKPDDQRPFDSSCIF
jgi:PAS domain S-box-containing protein